MIVLTLVLTAFAIVPMNVSAASTYYVDPSGSDVTGDGSSGDPWQTIQHAIDNAVDGDTIIVNAGIYEESITININNDRICEL